MKINLNNLIGKMLAMVLLSSLLTGCSGAAATPAATQPPAPTAAPTLPPSPTSQPTEPPTATPEPTATATQAPTATPIPTATETEASTATETVPPKPTTATPSLSAGVLRVWSFSNTTVFIANQGFTLAIYMKNTGASTWEPGYQLRFTGLTNGGDVTVQPEQDLTVEVKPGGKVEFDLWAFGSETLGNHTWYFQLYTAEGKKVPGSQCSFTFTMIHN